MSALQAVGRWWDVVEDCLWADCLKVLFFIVFFFFLFQEDESLSIDWEDRLPSYSQKSHVNICYMEILENIFSFLPYNRRRLSVNTCWLVAIVIGGSGKTQLNDEIINKWTQHRLSHGVRLHTWTAEYTNNILTKKKDNRRRMSKFHGCVYVLNQVHLVFHWQIIVFLATQRVHLLRTELWIPWIPLQHFGNIFSCP